MKTKGFSFIEVLVALFILAMGMLGMIELQMMGLHHTRAAYLRSVATQRAAALFEGNYTAEERYAGV